MLQPFIKRLMIVFLSVIGVLIIATLLFINFYPSFGAKISKEKQLAYQSSQQFKDGKFNNIQPVPKSLSFSETLSLAYTFFITKVANGRPASDLTPTRIDSTAIAGYKGEARLFWFGHSAFLLQIEGKTILIDPMLGKVASPHPLLGGDRFNKNFPLPIDQFPQIDAVIYSHDHYDHLDYYSVQHLKNKVKHFYVPLGVGEHLKAWGVPAQNITELDWWQSANLDQIHLVCTPAQHFSGRNINNSQSTLWASWVIETDTEKIYFSGDSGYASHFKEIGEKYGPFDLALMECGQYNEMWADIHMMPEETAQAGVDVKAKKVMPIHWAGFKLALHSWKDPIQRVQVKAKELNLPLITPTLGQEVLVNNDSLSVYNNWWEKVE